jgi:L-cysteine/cystine lyase
MPALANKTYFNYGGQGPLPRPSLEAIQQCWLTIQELGPFTSAVWPHVEGTASRLRQRLARWFGVGPSRVAFSENVTSGCVLPLWGLPWQTGDELLISDAEHPGVVAACRELAQRHGLGLATLPVRTALGSVEDAGGQVLEALETSLTPRTRLVVLSHLLWTTGQVMPIAAVAARLASHPQQPWLLVDGAQSLGSLPLAEAAGAADIYACTGHKWCCGPEGLGAMALSERVLEQGRPTLIGWRSLRDEGSGTSSFHRDGRRFEVATSCTPLMAGLDQSLQLLEACGDADQRLEAIRARSGQLWQEIATTPGLQPLLAVPPPAGLVSLTLGEGFGSTAEGPTPETVVAALARQGIWLRSLQHPDCVRACTHLTTTSEEVTRLSRALAALAAEQARPIAQAGS